MDLTADGMGRWAGRDEMIYATLEPIHRPARSTGEGAVKMAEEGPILDQINLVVSDMEATVDFYRRLGLDIPDTDPAFQHHHRSARLPGGVDFDIDSVEFARHWDKGWRGGPGVIGFKVETREQVDAVYADLTSAGYVGQQEPYDAFWGARYAIVEDPSGNAVGLMSPIDPSRRSVPEFP